MIEDYITVISNIGFPIFVALYLLLRFEKIIKNQTKAVNDLHHTVKDLHTELSFMRNK
tara:strand:- start:143 stop:316 length:174 start_codon:yes stop_codon:yes gene_type:complete